MLAWPGFGKARGNIGHKQAKWPNYRPNMAISAGFSWFWPDFHNRDATLLQPVRLCLPLLTDNNIQAQIQHARRMGERPNRNQIDAGFSNRPHGFEINPAGGFT